jgi:hypothetical protein
MNGMRISLILFCRAICVIGLAFLGGDLTVNGQLLPFQGKLSNADGSIVSDGARLVQFKLYDAPIGGDAIWNGEVHKLSVNDGLINTILGSKASMEAVDFNQTVYLETTMDANGDNTITPADPPMLPRQIVLPAPFAHRSDKAGDAERIDGEVLFKSTNTGGGRIGKTIDPRFFPNGGIPSSVIAGIPQGDSGVQGNQIATGAIDIHHLTRTVVDLLTPVGSIMAYWGDDDPPGWIICDGRSLETNQAFARLREMTGPYAPDLRGHFLRGLDTSGQIDSESGRMIGHKQDEAVGSHNHQVVLPSAHSDNGDGRGYGLINVGNYDGPEVSFNVSAGGAEKEETRPVNIAVNFIIKY